MLYEFSISSQLAGAIILLIWSFSKVSKNAIEMCFPGITTIERDDDGNGIIKKEKLQKNVKTIFLNIWAFICIVLGYLSSIFSQNDMKDLHKKLIIIVIMTILFVLVGEITSTYSSKGWYREDVKISPEELDNYDVMVPITEKEVDDMFKE